MSKPELESMPDKELVVLYQKAALDHHQATDLGEPKIGNEAHDQLSAVYRELRRRGAEAQSLLLPLLSSPEQGVRGWAAAHALEFAPEKGAPVLEALSREPRFVGFDAKMTLKVWREGKLEFP